MTKLSPVRLLQSLQKEPKTDRKQITLQSTSPCGRVLSALEIPEASEVRKYTDRRSLSLAIRGNIFQTRL